MENKKSFSAIDYFRIVAAVLVIAIHTSPLESFNGTADFILTRIIARTAVPFFFMVSGFFLLGGLIQEERIKLFIKKTAVLYSIAIICYLPLNLYNGYFHSEYLLPELIRDILFNGTLYHLWYLPAAISGIFLSYVLLKRAGLKRALWIAGALYTVGLFGDSYFGLSEKLPAVHQIYSQLFLLFDYTRNGIFFAPVFFLLGAVLANHKPLSLKTSLIGLSISLLCMTAEGLLLHHFHLQKHDSMYIMLLPCMYFLFSALIHSQGKHRLFLPDISMLLYLIHPMIIVAVRLLAKLFHSEHLLIENSLVHFFIVAAASALFSVFFGCILAKKKAGNPANRIPAKTDRAWLEINLSHIRHNASVLQEMIPNNGKLMAVVKAEAYGHGAVPVAQALNQAGINAFSVATVDEGISLRKQGICGEILILGYTAPCRAKQLKKYRLIQTVADYAHGKALNACGIKLQVHIKIDTGMHRLGSDCHNTNHITKLFHLKNLEVCGIYTHLCAADSLEKNDSDFTKMQIEHFYSLLDELARKGIVLPKTHIQSSYGLLNYPELCCDYVRIGIALYGTYSHPDRVTRCQPALRPALSLKARIILIREVRKGETIGYGRTYTAEHDCRIAILPVGYADGLPRSLSCGKGNVLIHGQKRPVVGRVCMDQLAVDITGIEHVRIGDIATLIGSDQTETITAEQTAADTESITNELLSRLGQRLPRIYL